MLHRLNIQYFISYLGIIPFLFIIIDKFFLFQIDNNIYQDFIIYYSLVIIVFIGATNWNLQEKIDNFIIIYGFSPSLFSLVIIILNLYKFNFFILFILLNLFFLYQLILDYFFIYSKRYEKKAFYFLRLPLTFKIVISLLIIVL